MVQGKTNTGRPPGTPTIRLGTTPSGLSSAHFHHPPLYSFIVSNTTQAWMYIVACVCSVVTTIELSPPPRWLATIEPPPPPRCCTVFWAVFSAPFHDSFHILCHITDHLHLQRRDRPLFVDGELWGVVGPGFKRVTIDLLVAAALADV